MINRDVTVVYSIICQEVIQIKQNLSEESWCSLWDCLIWSLISQWWKEHLCKYFEHDTQSCSESKNWQQDCYFLKSDKRFWWKFKESWYNIHIHIWHYRKFNIMYPHILTTSTAHYQIIYLYHATNVTHIDHHLLISCPPSNLDINWVQFPLLSNSLLTTKSHLIWATHSSCDQSYQIFPWNSYCVWILDSFLKHSIDLHHAKSKSFLSSLNVGTTWPKTV